MTPDVNTDTNIDTNTDAGMSAGPRQPVHRAKGEQARQLATEAIDKLAQALRAGKSDTLRSFLTAIARFHQYSFGNVMLIAAQRPDATQVAGFHTWRKLGRPREERRAAILIEMS